MQQKSNIQEQEQHEKSSNGIVNKNVITPDCEDNNDFSCKIKGSALEKKSKIIRKRMSKRKTMIKKIKITMMLFQTMLIVTLITLIK